ncbi:hypothetical protein GCK72_026135 [Caenorhabditis remanei]|uniref:Uncharacterized protein n=1 Tax=Caenorhabditis remanei TaxID=31234 RepID=A0A6A5G407_CAERE|nr:hypothetical protein GCK72_026135 [Caenorhabditis remanei]KAF1749667.1 hypothetical protein GCK72_026135 [Caenorhabditis remanei]
MKILKAQSNLLAVASSRQPLAASIILREVASLEKELMKVNNLVFVLSIVVVVSPNFIAIASVCMESLSATMKISSNKAPEKVETDDHQ